MFQAVDVTLLVYLMVCGEFKNFYCLRHHILHASKSEFFSAKMLTSLSPFSLSIHDCNLVNPLTYYFRMLCVQD